MTGSPSSFARVARRAYRLALAALLSVAITRGGVAQQQRLHNDIVTGHVTGEAAQPLDGADVVITIAPSAATLRTRSDSAGNYRIAITNGSGEYLLFIGMIGRTPFRKRLTATGGDTAFTVDARLAPVIQALAAVNVQAKRVRPARALGSDGPPGNDATDKTADGVNGTLSPDLQSNFDARASTVAGLAVTPNGISAFGLGSDANSTKLNGLDFGGGDLPRDARFEVRFRTSPWDPTSGGYAGVQTSITLAPGGNIARRYGHVTLDGPFLQSTSPTSRQLGQSYTSLSLDEGGIGAYALDNVFYDFGVHVGRKVSSGASLGDHDPVVLNALGISPDSAARVVAALPSIGIPNRVGDQPTRRTATDISFVERIDRAPRPAVGDGPPGPTLALTMHGRYSALEASALTPTVTPAFASHSTNAGGGIQGLYSGFFGDHGTVLNETTSGVSIASNHSAPYAALPSASVTIVSDSALGLVTVGGNGFAESDRRTWSWETVNRTAWQLRDKESLPVSVYLQSRFDGFDDTPAANRYGRFGYTSATDFVANRPSSFSRTLNIADRRGGQWIGASAIGGDWIAKTLKVTGGVRLDANAFTTAPAGNDEVQRLFDVNTHTTPNNLSFSPRLGFVWKYRPARGFSSIGAPPSVIYRGQNQLRGGTGKFQGTLPSTLLGDAIAQTGARNGMAQLLCVGAAVPTPDWRAYATDASAIPTSCAAGAANFADTGRVVSTFARNFAAPESWRANLGWTSSQFLKSYVTLDATYSRTSHVSSTLDLNFSGDSRFTLPGEGGRPVFVEAPNIAASSGAMTTADSRRFAQFGRVAERLSDLRSDTRQLSIYMMPNLPIGRATLIGSYTYTDSRVQTRGFDFSTSGDPRAVDWSRSAFTPKHTFISQAAMSVFRIHMTVSGLLRVTSGVAYTPLVSGDVNGDGASNDRAFVFDPSGAAGQSSAPGITQLLNDAPRRVHDCLTRQIGNIAGANSCDGPWTATVNSNVSFYRLPRFPDATINVNFANITGGLDQMLHGADHLHSWGTAASPDPVLLQVRSFDQATKAFAYDVNQRFGSTTTASAVLRNPFRVTIDLQFALGRSTGEQAIEQNMRVKPSLRGTRASADTLKARYLRTAGTDIYAQMLRLADSLALSRSQTEALQQRQMVLRRRADSIYTIFADHLAQLPENFDRGKAAQEAGDTRDSLWVVIRGERDFIKQVLTPGQLRLLPSSVREMVGNVKSGVMFFGGGWTPLPRTKPQEPPRY